MQPANVTPAETEPRLVEMLAPIPAPGGGENAPELLLALLLPLPLALEGVVWRLATAGDFEPPPQPAAISARPPSPVANTAPRRATCRRLIPSGEQTRLKRL